MKVSARNQLQGVIKDIVKGATTSHVQIEVGSEVIMASITNEAVEELRLAKGQKAYAVIKASDVMVGVRLNVASSRARHRRPLVRRVVSSGASPPSVLPSITPRILRRIPGAIAESGLTLTFGASIGPRTR